MGSKNGPPPIDVTEFENEEDDVGFFYDLISAPCFRQSTLYGVGGGAAIGALNLIRSRDVMRSAETMVKTGCGISLLTWVACRRQYYVQREMTYDSLEKYREQAARQAAARARPMLTKKAKESTTTAASDSSE